MNTTHSEVVWGRVCIDCGFTILAVNHNRKKYEIWTFSVCTYYLQLKVVSQARRAVHPEQNGVFLLGAEAKGEPVCPGAGAFIGGPRVNHHASIAPKDISSPSWYAQIKTHLKVSMSTCHEQCYLSSQVPYCRLLFFWNVWFTRGILKKDFFF